MGDMMAEKIGIYLAGSIKKGHENPQESFWTESDIALIRDSFQKYEVVFLNPAFRMDNLGDQHSVFGRDMTQVLPMREILSCETFNDRLTRSLAEVP